MMFMALGVVGLFAVNYFQSARPEASSQAIARTPGVFPSSTQISTNESAISQAPVKPVLQMAELERESFKRDIIKKLLAEYRDVISSVVAQVSLMDLRAFVIDSFPEDGLALFEEIIRAAFPELADDILASIALMDQYDQWLLDNMLALNDMYPLEKNGRVWEKRTELFGEHAREIWSDELSAAEERQENMQKTLSLLNKADDTDINERLFMLKSAMEENYDDTMESLVFGQGLLSKVFFGLESVQKDLHAMEPEARQEQINSVRRNLGFTEEQIAKAEQVDQAKDKRWQNGYQYMAEKQALISSYHGDDLESEIDKLREKYFKHEALTIRLEEGDEFFRFKRPRLYGRN